MILPGKSPYYLMFPDQSSHITNLNFTLLNDFCDFNHWYFPNFKQKKKKKERERHLYVFAAREIRNVFNKIAKVSENMLKYKTYSLVYFMLNFHFFHRYTLILFCRLI